MTSLPCEDNVVYCEDKVGHLIFRWDKSLKLKSEAKSFVWDLINM